MNAGNYIICYKLPDYSNMSGYYTKNKKYKTLPLAPSGDICIYDDKYYYRMFSLNKKDKYYYGNWFINIKQQRLEKLDRLEKDILVENIIRKTKSW